MATTRPRKDYEAIAASKIRDPDTSRPPRWLIYARNKKGKTRFSLTAPNCLVLDPEGGTDPYGKYARATKSKIWPMTSWDDIEESYQYLRRGNHPYEWVALDGLTRMGKMSLRWVMSEAMERDLDRRPNQIGKQDYGKAGEMLAQMLHNFSNLPMGVIYTCQERMIEGMGGEEDEDADAAAFQFVPDLPRGARVAVNSIVDVIARLYVVRAKVKIRKSGEIHEEERDQRRLWLAPHVSYDTGYRSEYVLPPFLKNPTVPNLAQLIREGKVSNASS